MTTGKYFNRGVMALDFPHVGYVVRETDDKIIILGDYNYRFDVPKSGIKEVGRNVILNMDFSELASKYKVDKNAPLPTGEPVDKINDDAYPESYYYNVSKEEKDEDENNKKNNNIAKSIANMVIGNNRGDNSYYDNTMPSSTAPIAPLVIDAKTLVAQTQDRMWKAFPLLADLGLGYSLAHSIHCNSSKSNQPNIKKVTINKFSRDLANLIK